jgi:hypothetical protein
MNTTPPQLGVYNLNLEELYKYKNQIYNWKHNRPMDDLRINPIMAYIEKTGRVEGIIYFTRKTSKDGRNFTLECYDGIHRLHALFKLYEKRNSYEDILGMDNRVIMVLLDIMDDNEQDVMERFININSSLPVPEIYTEKDKNLDNIYLIEQLQRYYKEHYRIFLKNSDKANIPHINFTDFADKMKYIFDNCSIESRKFEVWKMYHIQFNGFMSSLPVKKTILKKDEKFGVLKLTNNQQKKCQTHNMYVFAAINWEEYFLYYLRDK